MEQKYRESTEDDVAEYQSTWSGPHCWNCRFFDEYKPLICADIMGEDGTKFGTQTFWDGVCRRYAPRAIEVSGDDYLETKTRWPKVIGCDFCGEHKATS